MNYNKNILVGINSYVGSISKELELSIETDYNLKRANQILELIILKLNYIGIKDFKKSDFVIAEGNFKFKEKEFNTLKELLKFFAKLVKDIKPKRNLTKSLDYYKLLNFVDELKPIKKRITTLHLNRNRFLKGL